MLVRAVAGVDHRHVGVLRGHARRTVEGIADDDQIRVVLDHAHRIGNCLALGNRGRARVRHRDHLATEAEHGAFKGEPRARAGLEKSVHDPVTAWAGRVLQAATLIRQIENCPNLRITKPLIETRSSPGSWCHILLDHHGIRRSIAEHHAHIFAAGVRVLARSRRIGNCGALGRPDGEPDIGPAAVHEGTQRRADRASV